MLGLISGYVGIMNNYSVGSWLNIQFHVFSKGIQETLVVYPLSNRRIMLESVAILLPKGRIVPCIENVCLPELIDVW